MAERQVILVGAGPAHLVTLRDFIRQPLRGARLALVAPAAAEPYSGAVPAVMAGRWPAAEAMVALDALAHAAGAELVPGRAEALDRAARRLVLSGGGTLGFDILSLNTGAAPLLVPGAAEHALPLKPLAPLLAGWEAALRPDLDVAVAGGGAAAAEAALAAAARLGKGRVTIVSPAPPGAALGVAGPLGRALSRAGVAWRPGRVARVSPGVLHLDGGGAVPFGLCLWAAGAAPPAWLESSGLARDAAGWFRADDTMRAAGEDAIFLAGDLVAGAGRDGVTSVRQGAVLAHNLRAALEGRALRRFHPQRRRLALLQAPPGAVAAWGGVGISGRWVLRWKDRIDRRWLASLRPAMQPASAPGASPPHG